MTQKRPAFSIVELLIAMGISAIVITTAVGTVGQIYVSQKKVLISQDFYSEVRFLMERLVQIARNNTIDYDKYFVMVGPENDTEVNPYCEKFDGAQIPLSYPTTTSGDSVDNSDTGDRATLGYPNIFYWDTNNDDKPDRHMGGEKIESTIAITDPCTQAFHGTIDTLYMINSSRTVQTAVRKSIRNDDSKCDTTTTITDPYISRYCNDAATRSTKAIVKSKVSVQRRIGADTDNDGKIDVWKTYSKWDTGSNNCKLYDAKERTTQSSVVVNGETVNLTALGISSKDACEQAHPWTIISPHSLNITDLIFSPAPDRDPYLNFRVDSAQVHPHVFISMTAKLRQDEESPAGYAFDANKLPEISLQTSASSRVFGDSRK